ncbi:TetR/AcrR family transcriptional regulator [Clavibacter michiganensis subsp. phaseoli]|uniref:TetR/AcrR family transcriptional regulator n=1 Tax=Clavibacter phaseoli TaxID=1734031 RepID=A0A8I0SN11_9MICO|nr:TetR/AcrR family transcriptional regulator [Clavibacter phaseoli]MBF4632744.1 TetR/AcrR family transcriptional regulator [Clavibacter phaseoli]
MASDSTSTDARDRLLDAARAELLEHGLAGVSLRGIARRAEVSHAAPKYFFGDRAGLLTAIATAGFQELTEQLRSVAGGDRDLGDLGRAYVHFGLDHPALFELMFRPEQLHPEDPELQRAQAESIAVLASATTTIDVEGDQPEGIPPLMALVSWAFAHGLVALVRDGALGNVSADTGGRALADELIAVFDRTVR